MLKKIMGYCLVLILPIMIIGASSIWGDILESSSSTYAYSQITVGGPDSFIAFTWDDIKSDNYNTDLLSIFDMDGSKKWIADSDDSYTWGNVVYKRTWSSILDSSIWHYTGTASGSDYIHFFRGDEYGGTGLDSYSALTLTQATPEPEKYMTLLLVLGVGFLVYRRKRLVPVV